MWRDSSGYYLKDSLSDTDVSLDVDTQEDTPLNLKGNTFFINCGGTIVSEPQLFRTGVVPVRNLLKVESVKLAFERNKISYHPGIKKLSEDFTLDDYNRVEQLVIGSKVDRIILCHGTDYTATFSTYADLLAKKYKKKILVLVSQRSLDKPTSDLVHLLDISGKVFPKMHASNALVLVRLIDGSYEVHSPYEIRKYDTFSKKCFFSENFLRFHHNCPCLRSLSTRILQMPKPMEVGIETFFSSPNSDIIVGSGLGNTRSKTSSWVYTRCLNGPLSYSIYNKDHRMLNYTSRVITSWQSLEAFSKLVGCLL